MDLVKVEELRDSIRVALSALPNQNTFGESNLKEKAEMREQIEDLNVILQGGVPTREDVLSWWQGEDDYFLNDYL